MKRWNKKEIETLIAMVNQGFTYDDIAEVLGRNWNAVRQKSQKLKLEYNPTIREQVQCIQCSTMFSCLISENRKFCTQSCSASFNNSLRKKYKQCVQCHEEFYSKHNTQKYCGAVCFYLDTDNKRKEIVTAGKASDRVAKRYLADNDYSCAICNISDWQGNELTLELDHIDGNHENNNPDNIRLLCPNCHSQTDTYKAKNKGHGRKWRKKYYLND